MNIENCSIHYKLCCCCCYCFFSVRTPYGIRNGVQKCDLIEPAIPPYQLSSVALNLLNMLASCTNKCFHIVKQAIANEITYKQKWHKGIRTIGIGDIASRNNIHVRVCVCVGEWEDTTLLEIGNFPRRISPNSI